jgi:predicted AlkP superfamily pyrophosphatase or phosphodiesterase
VRARPLVVIDVVGLTPALLAHAPALRALAADGFMATLDPVIPAVTCTAQSSMLTGTLPREHGIVGNGWYFRDLAEVWFWRQANQLVMGEKVWEAARQRVPDFTCAQTFWWYNMYASVDWSVTLRPIYPADGRKIPALYSYPASLQAELESELGAFPMFNFWGPAAGIQSSQWIARCAQRIQELCRPTLQLVYLPHLDYSFQQLGPGDARVLSEVAAIDALAGKLIEHARSAGCEVLVVSEYGIEDAVATVHINRVLREQGYVSVRDTLGWEQLDFGASRAFAVADHQIAHVYVSDPRDVERVRALLARTHGIERVLDAGGKAQQGLDHPRSGELIAIAERGHWFSYYYWQDNRRAPDYARTVDIHRKPGYDPVELFVDPKLRLPKAKIALRLAQKKLGFRMLMDVIPLDTALVKGTHGRAPSAPEVGPLVIGSSRALAAERFAMTEVKSLILRHWE